jgi:2'-5' RNA ligase
MLPTLLQPELLSFVPDQRRLKLSRPGQLHLTLHFHGELPDDRSLALEQELSGIRQPRFSLQVAGTGVFEQEPGIRGVLWAGVRLNPPLQRLYDAVTQRVTKLGLRLEDRPWSPHITLARYSGGAIEENEMQRFLRRGRRLAAEFPVERFELMQSKPDSLGSVYIPRAVFLLGEDASGGNV